MPSLFSLAVTNVAAPVTTDVVSWGDPTARSCWRVDRLTVRMVLIAADDHSWQMQLSFVTAHGSRHAGALHPRGHSGEASSSRSLALPAALCELPWDRDDRN